MSLIGLAKKGDLPTTQFMDWETVSWIEKNRPNFQAETIAKNFLPTIKKNLNRFAPPKAWFFKKERTDTIHGLRHTTRVIANISYLVQENKITNYCLITEALVAASLHDLRRKNDQKDQGHGQRSSCWFIQNNKIVTDYFKVKLTKENVKEIAKAIELHETPYQSMNQENYRRNNKRIVDLLKSADALDRYRLPKLEWWINDQYLNLVPSNSSKLFAYTLVLKSEKNFLKTKKSLGSVLTGLGK
ncbi:MAG: hypothetical protein XD98_0434 [Microgenomates bacterium 39_6]|nr:MAG: hypothetical protein XD98_0434 [Microgenomates bacterium 39_6]